MSIPMQTVVDGFSQSLWLIDAQTKGLKHADSLLQLPFRCNCMNWVLGHILEARHDLMKFLKMDLVVTDAMTERYRSRSEPITQDSEGVLKVDDIVAAIHRTQQPLA